MARKVLSQSAGVSERYLAQLEAGEGNASVLLLRSVARALGMPLTELIDPREIGREAADPPLPRRLARAPARGVVFRLMRDFGHEEAARKKRIALVGLRGAGKTTLGSALARGSRMPFVELDREIEREAGISLSEVFLLYGQAGYRRIERRCLERVIDSAARDGDDASAAASFRSPRPTTCCCSNCFTVWVKAAPEEHMARVVAQGDFRPMQGNAEAMDDLKRILDAREPLYRKADVDARHVGRASRAEPCQAAPGRRGLTAARKEEPHGNRRSTAAAAHSARAKRRGSSPTTRIRTATRTGSSRSTARSRR